MTRIRPTQLGEEHVLQEIEELAGEQFRGIGMDWVADDAPPAIQTLAAYTANNRSWVALDAADVPVGYVLADVVDDCAHVEQVSVRPEHQGQGHGRALLDRVRVWTTERGLSAVTLTTFNEVPWNAPLYRHLGFRELSEDEIGPELRAVVAGEATHGLDPTQRLCMRAEVRADTSDTTVADTTSGSGSAQ